MKRILPLVLATLIVALTLKAINEVQTDQAKLHLKEIKIQNINRELDKLQADYKKLELDKSKTEKEKQDKIKQLQDRQKELEEQLQAKRLLKAQEAKVHAESVNTAPVAQNTPKTPANASGTKYDWMRQAGIPESDWQYVDYIVSRESGWRYTAQNPSSYAYGLCQSLPGNKMASAGADWLTNPVTQLKWCHNYANRYGGWYGSYLEWQRKSWW